MINPCAYMNTQNKLFIIIVILALIIFILTLWFAYSYLNPVPVDPMLSDGAKSAREFEEKISY